MIQTNDFNGYSQERALAELTKQFADQHGVSVQDTARHALAFLLAQAKEEGRFTQELGSAVLDVPIFPTIGDTAEHIKKQQGNTMQITPKGRYSLLASQRPAEEIREDIGVMTTFLACSELLFADQMQRYSRHILQMLQEKNLYRHELKKYANKLREVTDAMMLRSNCTDRSITLKQCSLISPKGLYGKDFYEEGGGLLGRMSLAFHKDFEVKFKRIRMDNKWIADSMKLKHPDLLAEIFTLTSLAQCDIELFDAVQKKLDSITRGRLKSKSCIKSTHSEAMRNAARNLSDRFVNRMAEMPTQQTLLMRQHIQEFQQDITGGQQFEFFNGQFLALKMEVVEYYLARLRMDMTKGRIGVEQIRDVWYRMGRKENVRKFFSELKAIPLPEDDDMDALDYSRVVAMSKGDQKAMNSFRRLSTNGERILPEEETQEQWECRVLRTVARKYRGELPDDVLRSMIRVHVTKKAVMQRLQQAGFELAPTLRRIRKMKLTEIKQL